MQNLIIEADGLKTVRGNRYDKFGAMFDCCELDEKLAQSCGRRAGNYITVQTDKDTDISKALRHALGSFVKKRKRAILVGLGNGDVVADALGKSVVERLKNCDIAGGRISVFAPDVGALTNLDSVKLVQAVSYGFSPDYVIAVDALATSKEERLGACYQFTDSGLRPGGGIGKGSLLDSELLKTRFIAIGVPFIISGTDLGAKSVGKYYVPYDVDEKVKICALAIADAVYACFS